MQQVPSQQQQQQQQQQQLLKQQQSQAAHDDVLSPSQQARPPPAPLPPSSSGTFPASGTQQQQPPQQQICISLASNVPTVTMAGLPQPTSANQSGLRSVGVITDPNAPTLLPTLQQQQQSSSQAQVNVSATSFSPLPPKKLRYGGNPVETATAVNTSVSQHNPHSAPTASTLLFASKSSVTASSVLPPPPPALSSQQPPIVSAVSATAAPPPSSSTSVNPNIVQTMLLSSNLASFNQAQSLQSQQQMQSQQQHQQQQTGAGNLVITSPTSVSNLQNVSIKSFVPSSESMLFKRIFF